MIDAGDPSILTYLRDLAATIRLSDIGPMVVGLLDDDNDGVTALFDCDDSSNTTFPGAAENESLTECMRDADEDGYGDSSAGGTVVAGTDCDDSDDDTFVGAAENESTTQCTNGTMMVMGTIAPLTVTLAVAMIAMTAMLLLVRVL